MKVHQRFKFAATAFMMVFGSQHAVHGQKCAQAVMTVSVQIVSAPELISNIITDISEQLHDRKENLSLGNFSLKFPEGMGYSISFDPVIKMAGKTDSWDINTSLQEKTDGQGKLTLSFTGKSTASTVSPGTYKGQLTTRIEYL